jgi:hypothetical protein
MPRCLLFKELSIIELGTIVRQQAWTYVLGISFQSTVRAPGQTAVYSMVKDGVAQIWVSKPVYRPWTLGLLYFQNFGLVVGWQLPSLRTCLVAISKTCLLVRFWNGFRISPPKYFLKEISQLELHQALQVDKFTAKWLLDDMDESKTSI